MTPVRPALVGRSRPLAQARDVLQSTVREGRGAAILLTGEAGIGKSAVARAVMEQASRLGYTVGYGKAEQGGQIAPGAPLLLALRFGAQPVVTAAELDALSAVAGRPVWLIDRVGRLMEERSASTPVLVVMDDFQWTDRVTQVAVGLLADRLLGLPVVWLIVGRGTPAALAASLDVTGTAAFPVHPIELDPLEDAAIETIATQVLGAAPDLALTHLLQGAAGNPLVALQFLAGTAGPAELTPALAIEVTLTAAVRARLHALSADARHSVQLVAVWGEPISRSDLLALSPSPSEGDVVAAADEAVAADLLVESDRLLRLRHDLVRDAVYDDIPSVIRAELHRRSAEILLDGGRDALTAARHVRAAARRGDLGAAQMLCRAAEQSVGPLPETAAELARQAFGLVPATDPSWLEVGEACASILVAVQHGREALDVVDLLLTRVVDGETRARLLVVAAPALWLAGRLSELVRRVDAGLAEAASEATKVQLSAWRAVAMTRLGTAVAAREAAELVLRQARALADVSSERVALQALGEVARNTLDQTTALAHFQTLRISAGTSYLGPELAALRLLDRFREAGSVIDAVARETDSAQLAGLLPVVEGRMWQHYMLGRLDDARAEALTLQRVSRAVGVPIAELEATMTLALVAIHHGRLTDARQLIRDAQRRNQADQIVRTPRLTLLRSLLAGLQGDPTRAVAMVRPVMDVAEQSNGYFPRLPEWMPVHTRLAVAAGDRVFAQQSADRAERAADRNAGVASLRGLALQARGLAESDVDLLGAAVGQLEHSPRPALLADALSDLGQTLLRHGSLVAAVGPLRRAHTLLDEMGAVLDRGRVARALRDAGSPIEARQPDGDVWHTLTPAETRVAELISAGLTNGSAARRLGISPNTVSTHLRSVFAKLDVSSRVQLANRWHTRPS